MEFITDHYLLFKAIHIIGVISWMAGMFYLPRLYVYHVKALRGSEMDLTFQTMERRLLRIIINPSMIISIVFGLPLIAAIGFQGGWLHAKLLLVAIMLGIHMILAKFRKDFERGENKRSEKFYRILNEIPPLLMIGIVLFVVLKPF